VDEWGSLFAKKKTKVEERKKKPDHRASNDKSIPKSSLGAEVKPKAPALRRHMDHVTAVRQEIIDIFSVPYSSPNPLKSEPLLLSKPKGAIIALVKGTTPKNAYPKEGFRLAHASITACYISLARAKVKDPCKRRQLGCVLVLKIRKGSLTLAL
jgi:hypothetical protein